QAIETVKETGKLNRPAAGKNRNKTAKTGNVGASKSSKTTGLTLTKPLSNPSKVADQLVGFFGTKDAGLLAKAIDKRLASTTGKAPEKKAAGKAASKTQPANPSSSKRRSSKPNSK